MKIVAIDPGMTTGYAYCTLKSKNTPPLVLSYGEGRGLQTVKKLLEFDADLFILENFMLRPEMAKIVALNDPDLITVQVLGALKYSLPSEKIKIQHPFQKSQIPDSELKKYGMYSLQNSKHTRDAFRHILYFWMKGL